MKNDLFSDILDTPEVEVVTFADLFKRGKGTTAEVAEDDAAKIASGEVDKVVVSTSSKKQISGFIHIESGHHDDDYFWHISPVKRRWKVSQERVLYAIGKTINSIIPHTIQGNLEVPNADWDIPCYSVKLFGVRSAWNVNYPPDMEKITEKLFEVLNTLV